MGAAAAATATNDTRLPELLPNAFYEMLLNRTRVPLLRLLQCLGHPPHFQASFLCRKRLHASANSPRRKAHLDDIEFLRIAYIAFSEQPNQKGIQCRPMLGHNQHGGHTLPSQVHNLPMQNVQLTVPHSHHAEIQTSSAGRASSESLLFNSHTAGLLKQSHALHQEHSVPPSYLLPHVSSHPPHTLKTAS